MGHAPPGPQKSRAIGPDRPRAPLLAIRQALLNPSHFAARRKRVYLSKNVFAVYEIQRLPRSDSQRKLGDSGGCFRGNPVGTAFNIWVLATATVTP